MKTTINFNDFYNGFKSLRPENFTFTGLLALFDWLECGEELSGEEQDFDIIALCCDFTEYENMEEFQGSYGDAYKTIEDIENETTVIPINDDSFIIQNF